MTTAAEIFESELEDLAHEIVAAIQREVPDYAGRLRGEFGLAILAGVEHALRRFQTRGTNGSSPSRVYYTLGRNEHTAGRSLDALQAAYRVGARVAWRRMSRLAADAGVSVEGQHQLAEAIFAYIDELAAESVEGYAEAQAADAGSLQSRRQELLTLLLETAPVAPTALHEAAALARWRLPRRVVAIAVPPEAVTVVAGRLGSDALHMSDSEHGAIVLPAAGRVQTQLATVARRHEISIGLGPSVPLAEASRSWRWAMLARGAGGRGELVEAEQQLAAIAMQAIPDILVPLRRCVMAPLEGESPASYFRLEATLRAWLRHRGAQAAIAAELGVHPQTVRYRMVRLRELFGSALDDPDARFAMELALRAPT